MSNTRHIQTTLSNEEIDCRLNALIEELVPEYARESRTLTAEDSRRLAKKLFALRDELERIARKGGCVLICEEATEITTYRVNSYKPNLRSPAALRYSAC